jgi:uncharacterized protein (TIGR02145 family)
MVACHRVLRYKVCYITTWAITDVFDCVSDSDSTSLENQTSPVTVNNLTNGKTYYFVVGAVNSTKSYATSNVIAVTPKAEAVIKPEGFPTSGYTKIANDGSKLADSANLGANLKDWACTRDNKTGLTWEVKTTDGGLRDMNNQYRWNEPDTSKNGGDAGEKLYIDYDSLCKGSDCDTYAYTNAINVQGLCGAKDWRMPTNEELKGLVDCLDGGQYEVLSANGQGRCKSNESKNLNSLTINTTYFPNTGSTTNFWSSSSYYHYHEAWFIHFSNGYNDVTSKGIPNYVRLVRSGQ